MHDPCTLAFSFLGIDIWHVDPEVGGNEDSCDWFGSYRKLNEAEKVLNDAIYYMETVVNNPPYYPNDPAHVHFQKINEAKRKWLKRGHWRWHPRWHFWHWRIKIGFIGDLHRWLWSRCAGCGKRFPWGYSPCSTQWDSAGPGWFRGEKNVYHHHCVGNS